MSGPSTSGTSLRRVGAAAVVSIDRAARLNTLSRETLAALAASFRALAGEPGLRVVVLAGAGGRAFAAGADLAEVSALTPRSAAPFSDLGQSLMRSIAAHPAAVVAAVDGVCMGGGLDLALACDLRYASPGATFAHPGAKRGILTGFGGTARLPRLLGRSRAIELFATGRTVGAAEALDAGLVDRVVDDPVAAALRLAEASADGAPERLAALRRSGRR